MADPVTVTVAQFRTDFPEFSSETTYSDAALQAAINRAKLFVPATNSGVMLDDNRVFAIELMSAHILTLITSVSTGNTSAGVLTSAHIDGVTISMIAPPVGGSLSYWLNQTIYGQQLLAFLKTFAPAGILAGGSLQRVLR